MRLGEEEHNALKDVKKLLKLYGISTFSETAQKTIKNGAKGSCIHLGMQLVIEHFQKLEEKKQK